jgi:hypothetical protein
MRFAAIADVHGNYLALEAVIADIRAQAIDEIVDLGDMASGPHMRSIAAGGADLTGTVLRRAGGIPPSTQTAGCSPAVFGNNYRSKPIKPPQ